MQTAHTAPSAEPNRTAVGPDLPPIKPLPPGYVPPHSPTDAPPPPFPPGQAPDKGTPDKTTSNKATLDAATPDAQVGVAVAAFQPRVYEPEEIACCHQNADLTNCGAEAGEPCNWQQLGEEGTYHAERIVGAAAASQREGIKPTEEQFDEAAWDSGLF